MFKGFKKNKDKNIWSWKDFMLEINENQKKVLMDWYEKRTINVMLESQKRRNIMNEFEIECLEKSNNNKERIDDLEKTMTKLFRVIEQNQIYIIENSKTINFLMKESVDTK